MQNLNKCLNCMDPAEALKSCYVHTYVHMDVCTELLTTISPPSLLAAG